MAFDDSQVQGTDDEQQRQSGQVAGNPITQLSGGSGGGFAGQGAAPASPSSPTGPNAPGTPTSSGQWTNLSDYLTANSDQSAGMGQTLANSVQGQAQTAESDLGNVITGFQNQTPYSTLNSTTGAQVDSAIDNAGQYAPTTTNGVTTPGDTTTAETYLNGGNSGGAAWGITPTVNDITAFAPTTGPTWGTVQNDYTTAGQSLQDTQSESGRDVLLQNQYGANGAQYTPGEQSFDQLLLEQNPGNSQALNNVYSQYAPNEVVPQATTGTGTAATTANAANAAGLSTDLYNALTNSQTYATGEQAKAAGFQTQAQNDLTGDIQNLGSSVSSKISPDSTAYQTNYDSLTADLANGTLTPAEQQELGLAAGPIDLYGVSPSTYLQEVSNPYSGTGAANAAASSGDWSNYEGLNALLTGLQGTPQATDQAQLSSIGMTGTSQPAAVSTNPTNFNLNGFNSAVSDAKAGMPAQIVDLINETDAEKAAAGGYTDYKNSLGAYDPTTNTFTVNYNGMGGQVTPTTYSLDPTAANFVGNSKGPDAEEGNWAPTAGAWSQLIAALNSKLDAKTTPKVVTR